jgi:hypothetical protein
MRIRTAVALMVCASWLPAARAADSSLLAQAPADSDVLVGINLKQIRESDLGKSILAQVGTGNPQFQAMAAMAGFDPLRDLDEVLIAAPAKPNPTAFLMLRGSFDAAKLSQLAAVGGMKSADYHGVKIFNKPEDQSGVSAMAIIDRSLVVGGNQAGVQAFVDRRGQPSGMKADLAAKAAEVSKANDIWLVMHAAPAAFAPESATAGPMGDLVKSIEEATLGLKLGSDIVLSIGAVAHTAQDAEGLAAAVRLFTGMAAAGQKDNKQVAALLQKLKVGTEGSTAKLTLTVSEADAEAAIRDAIASMGQAKPAATPAPGSDSGVVKLPAQKQ